MGTINAVIKIKDQSGTVYGVNPKTGISNVEGLQTALNSKVTTVKVGSTSYSPSSGVVSLPAYPTTLPASDVSSWAKASSKPSYTASEVGAIATTAKGAASGVAELDANGKVPSSQLPAYVDDVLEYTAKSSFPTTGETGKIYVDTTTNLTYRWSGSAYVEISPSLALGTTSSTAYRGDRGNTAYSHATDSSRLTTAQSSGLYKIATTAQGHIASVTAVAKSDITGLGIPGSDTNTHRPIQVNGTQVLGDNTTALNLKAGLNVSLSNSSGTVTIAATDTTYSAATQSANGLMSSTDKTKLDGIATGATANIGTVTQVKVGSTAYNPSSGVISLPAYPSDTNTHRPIQMNGTEILGNNTTALNLKAGSNVSLSNSSGTVTIAATDTTYSAATQSAAGLMSSTDKTKLDGIATGANNYSHPTTSGNKHIPSGGSSGQILRWSADGTATWGSDNNTWTAMVGATSSANGSVGYVNAVPPKDGYNTKYLRADGTWAVPPNTTYSSKSAASGGTDVSLVTTGEKYTWNNKGNGTVTSVKVGSTSYSPSSGVVSLPAYPTTLPASDVSSWAKASSKPSYTASEVGAAASSHAHGNIQNGGTLQSSDISIASGDKLIVTDASDSNKIARTSISFDGSTTTQALTKAGTWQTFNNYSHPTSAGNKHIPSGGSSGQILGYGGSSGTASWRSLPTVDSEFSASSTNAVQNKVVTSELAALIDDGAKNYAYIPDYFNQSGAGYYSDIYFNIPAGDWVLSYTLTTSANFAVAVTIDGSEEAYYDNSAPYSNTRISHTLKTATSGITRFRVYFNTTGTISNIMICKLSDWKISQKYVPYRTTLNTLTYRMRSYTVSSGAPVIMPLVRSETFTMILFGFVQTIGNVFWAIENLSGNTLTIRNVFTGDVVQQSALNFSLNVGDHMLTITTNISGNSNFMIMASTA